VSIHSVRVRAVVMKVGSMNVIIHRQKYVCSR